MNHPQARAHHFEAAVQLRAKAEQRRVIREAARVATDERGIPADGLAVLKASNPTVPPV